MSQKVMKAVAGVVALAAIGFGASAIASGNGGATSASMAGGPPGAAAGQAGGPGGAGGRFAPPGAAPNGGGPPGFGTPVTGATAKKVEAAALEKYPGTIERVMSLPDGSYVAHVIRSGGGSEVHVHVSKTFEVTGFDSGGGPPGGGAPPQAPRQGSSATS